MAERVKIAKAVETLECELPNGRVSRVREMDGACLDHYRRIAEDPAAGYLLWEIVGRCLPDATEEDVRSLTPSECSEVIRLAVRVQRDNTLVATALIQSARGSKVHVS